MKKSFLFLGLIFIIVLPIYLYNNNIKNPHSNNSDEISFIINPGEGVKQISRNLKKAGLIGSDFWFNLYIKQISAGSKLQAGEYILNPKMSIQDIVSGLVQGDIVGRERDMKIIEGWDLRDMDKYLKDKNFIDDDSFIKAAMGSVNNWQYSFDKPDFLDSVPNGVDIEGYLFPDTYRVFLDATAEQITKKMLDNFGQKLSGELRQEIAGQGKSIHDIITLASILEKEVTRNDDRAIVAGILYKRMNIGMHLEVDSSINYVTGKNDPGASYADLEIDSPYNTYKYYGLPPGPICNPGLDAIKAAVYPQDSPYLFYLNRQDTGETVFSRTFEEHVANKNKYLR